MAARPGWEKKSDTWPIVEAGPGREKKSDTWPIVEAGPGWEKKSDTCPIVEAGPGREKKDLDGTKFHKGADKGRSAVRVMSLER